MFIPLLPEVVPETNANPASFYEGLCLWTPLFPRSPLYSLCSSFIMGVHPIIFDLATPLVIIACIMQKISEVKVNTAKNITLI